MEQRGCEDVSLSDIITVSHVLFIVLITRRMTDNGT